MTETAIVAIVAAVLGAIPPTLVALANFRKAHDIIEKAEVIHKLVNSNLAKVTDELAQANRRIAELRQLLIDQDEKAG